MELRFATYMAPSVPAEYYEALVGLGNAALAGTARLVLELRGHHGSGPAQDPFRAGQLHLAVM